MIEQELSIYIAALKAAFPTIPIYTERVAQDCVKEGFYFEEVSSRGIREQPDTFIDITTYRLYFYPDLTDISTVQAKIRDMRRWQEINLMWMPFVKEFEYVQEEDNLVTTFQLWRHFRLEVEEAPLMKSLSYKKIGG